MLKLRIPPVSLLLLSCALLCIVPGPAMSQSPAPDVVQRGPSLGIDVARTSAWDVALSPPNAPTATISAATGLAVTAAWGVTPWLAPWVSYAASLYGESDPSAVSELAAGVDFRGPWFGRFVPSVGLGLGRTSAPTAGGFSFTHADLSAGAAWFVSRRIALRAGLHALHPVGDASASSNSGSTHFDVADARTQLRLGVRAHLGSGE